MKIQVISDLHTEMSSYTLESPNEYKTNADILVIAGDIAHCKDVVSIIRALFPDTYDDGSLGPELIIIVSGNHEHYQTMETIDEGHMHIRKAVEAFNATGHQKIIFLDDDIEIISYKGTDIRFVGGTLWTDFNLYGNPLQDAKTVASALNDYRLIAGSDKQNSYYYDKPRLTAKEVLKRFNKTYRVIKKAVSKKFDGPTIVVTHHLPSMKAVAEQYKTDRVSAGFASNVDELLTDNVALWCCGHTHSSSINQFDSGSLLVCNPAGYMRVNFGRENSQFNPKLLIDINKEDNKWIAKVSE